MRGAKRASSQPRRKRIIRDNKSFSVRQFLATPSHWGDSIKQKQYFESISSSLNVQKQHDWYNVTLSQLQKKGVIQILRVAFGGSLCEALSTTYPMFDWHPWNFSTSREIWTTQSKRQYFDWLASELSIETQDEWYRIGLQDVVVSSIPSPTTALELAYSEYTWYPWLFPNCPHSFWSVTRNQTKYFDWLADQLGIHTTEDWFLVTKSDLESVGYNTFNQNTIGSLMSSLQKVYPQYRWISWSSLPNKYWLSIQHQRKYLDWLAEELQLTQQEDLYSLRVEDIEQKLLQRYNHSISDLCKSVYPEFTWYPWLFRVSPYKFWANFDNHRKYFDWYAEEIGINSPEQWYQVSTTDIESTHGGGLLGYYYKDSLYLALKAVYPEHEWEAWRFKRIPDNFWDSKENIEAFGVYAAKKLHIQHDEEWDQITTDQMIMLGAGTAVKRHGIAGFASLLKGTSGVAGRRRAFIGKKVQSHLLKLIKLVFPNVPQIEVNFKHPQLKYIKFNTGHSMELDIFIPSLCLAFEYQGSQHYSFHKVYGDVDALTQDEEKRQACKNAGITLIEISHWWDNDMESLIATIHQHRPDLIPSRGTGTPIPTTPPKRIK